MSSPDLDEVKPRAAWTVLCIRCMTRRKASIKRSTSASVEPQPKLTRKRPRADVRRDAHGLKHMGARDLAGRARRAGRHRDAFEIERHQQRLGRESRDRETAWCSAAGAPSRRRSTTSSRRAAKPRFESVAKAAQRVAVVGRREPLRLPRRSRRRPARFRCPTEAHVPARRRGPAASRARRHRARTTAPVPLGPPSLWPEKNGRIGPALREAERHAADHLHGVADQEPARLVDEFGRRANRLHHPCLVVGGLQAPPGPATRRRRASASRRAVEIDARRRAPTGSMVTRFAVEAMSLAARRGCSVASVIRRSVPAGAREPAQARRQSQVGAFRAARREDDVIGWQRRASSADMRARASSTRARAARPS